MNILEYGMKTCIASIALLLFAATMASADINFTGPTYNQDFNSLSASGTSNAWANDSTISGWYLFRRTSASDTTPVAITNYDAGAGTSNTGKYWSFGSAGSAERALGGIASGNATNWGSAPSGSVAGWMSVAFDNGTGSTLKRFTVRFDGEQWRDGGAPVPNAQTMVMEYGFGTSFSAVTTWTAAGSSFNWSSPVFVNTTTGAAVDGNAAGLVGGVGGTINGLSWAPGAKMFIRWIENNDVGNDHGLALDNFSFTADAIPEPASITLLSLFGCVAFGLRRSRRA